MAFASKWLELAVRAIDIGSSKPVVQVYHYIFTGAGLPTLTPQAMLITSWLANNQGTLIAALSTQYRMQELQLRNLNNPLDAGETIPNVVDGLVAGDALPLFNAATLRCKTPIRGRSYMGSKHFGPIAEDSTTLEKLTAPAIVLFDALAASLMSTLVGNGGEEWGIAIYSPTVTNSPAGMGITNPTVTRVNAITTNEIVGTERRRKLKV